MRLSRKTSRNQCRGAVGGKVTISHYISYFLSNRLPESRPKTSHFSTNDDPTSALIRTSLNFFSMSLNPKSWKMRNWKKRPLRSMQKGPKASSTPSREGTSKEKKTRFLTSHSTSTPRLFRWLRGRKPSWSLDLKRQWPHGRSITLRIPVSLTEINPKSLTGVW